MRILSLLTALILSFPNVAASQQSSPLTLPQRDPQAVAILQQSVATMAANAPADSSATGTVTIVEGSATQTGSIQILTRGTAQSFEQLNLSGGQRTVVYSNPNAKEVIGAQSTTPSMELAVTEQCPDFPLPLLQFALNNPDAAFRYVGEEALNGAAVQHIQVWNSFASHSHLQHLAAFSLRDIWFDSTTGLPAKIAYTRRTGGGAAPSFPVEVYFSNYTNVSGVLYPFQIKKSFNGTPWQTITIQNVSFNTGLTDAQFQVG